MDTVIVLFEDDDGKPVYLDGDDDSGTNYNSKIEIRLIKGRTYYLRLRLYYSTGVGQGGIMLWLNKIKATPPTAQTRYSS